MQLLAILLSGGALIAAWYLFHSVYSKSAFTDRYDPEQWLRCHPDLHLGHLLELIDSSEVEVMSQDSQYKDSLLWSLSKFLLEDVLLLRRTALGFFGSLRVGLFYAGYMFVRAKSLLGLMSRRDFFFLAALELTVIRGVDGGMATTGEELLLKPKKKLTFGAGTLGLMLAFVSLLSMSAYAYHRDQVNELRSRMSKYQVVLDAVMISMLDETREETKAEMLALKAEQPEIFDDPFVQNLITRMIGFKRDPTQEKLNRWFEARDAFKRAYGLGRGDVP